MRLEEKKYLYDMRRAADLIAEFTKGKGDRGVTRG